MRYNTHACLWCNTIGSQNIIQYARKYNIEFSAILCNTLQYNTALYIQYHNYINVHYKYIYTYKIIYTHKVIHAYIQAY